MATKRSGHKTSYAKARVSVNAQTDVLTPVKYAKNIQNCRRNRHQQWAHVQSSRSGCK